VLQESEPPASTAVACAAAKKLAAWVGKAGGMPPVALIAAVSAVLRSYDAAVSKLVASLRYRMADSRPSNSEKQQPSESSSSGSSSADSTSSSSESSSSSSSSDSSSSGGSREHDHTAEQERHATLDRIFAVRLAHVQTLDRLSTLLQRQGSCAACPVIHSVTLMEPLLTASMPCVVPGKGDTC